MSAQTKRITFVIGSLDYGGAERHLVQLLPRLHQNGWDVDVFTLSATGAQAHLLQAQNIPVRQPPLPPKTGTLIYRVARLASATSAFSLHLLRRRPDIVHFFLPQAYLLGGICSLATGAKNRVMSRRSLNAYQERHRLAAKVERFLHGRMQAVLGNSQAVVSDLRSEGVPDCKLGLIYNGIDLKPFAGLIDRAAVRRSLGIDEDALVFVKLANLLPYKGHADLLNALSSAELPAGWRLVCVGRDDGELRHLKDLASRLRIAEHVIWTGSRTDVPDILGASDAGVLASHEEGFSNAVLEYMAAGLPSLVTNVGGNCEAIGGSTGLIVRAGDTAGMAAALVRLTDRSLRINMGQAARRRVKEDFSLESCVAAYIDLYESVLVGQGVPVGLHPNRVASHCR